MSAAIVSNMTRAEAESELTDLRGKLSTAFAEMGDSYDASKITVIDGDTATKAKSLRTMNDRAGELADRVAEIAAYDETKMRIERENTPAKGQRGIAPIGTGGEPDAYEMPTKSLGARFVESKAYTERKGNADVEVPWIGAEVKSDFLTSAGWAPQSIRSGVVVPYATRPISVVDLLTVIPTEQASYLYMEETTFTNNAAEAAEAAQYAEAAFALTERTMPISKIAVFLPVSDEQMADVREASAYVDARLPFMLRQRLDSQVLVGNGTPPNIKGFHNVTGLQTQAKGADPIFDAIFKGITLIETVGFSNAEGIVMNGTDWQGIRLTRTADGIYIMGNPGSETAKQLFGYPVATSQAQTLGTVLIGAFQSQAALVTRQGIEMKVSDSHSDYFIKGKSAIRASMRAALVTYRGAAFCEVTGV